jgi:hypothetical protein
MWRAIVDSARRRALTLTFFRPKLPIFVVEPAGTTRQSHIRTCWDKQKPMAEVERREFIAVNHDARPISSGSDKVRY